MSSSLSPRDFPGAESRVQIEAEPLESSPATSLSKQLDTPLEATLARLSLSPSSLSSSSAHGPQAPPPTTSPLSDLAPLPPTSAPSLSPPEGQKESCATCTACVCGKKEPSSSTRSESAQQLGRKAARTAESPEGGGGGGGGGGLLDLEDAHLPLLSRLARTAAERGLTTAPG